MDADVPAPRTADQQDAEAHKLADDRRDRRPGDAHAEHEDKQRIQRDVEDAARRDADHRVGGAALEAQLVIEDERRGHVGRAEQDVPRVIPRVGQDRLGRAEQPHERVEEDKAEEGDESAHDQRREKPGRGHARGVPEILAAEAAGDVVARALPEHEPDRLDDRHQRKDNAHRARRAGTDPTDEKGVRHVVDRGDHHADDRGDRQRRDEPRNGRLGHSGEFVRLILVAVHETASFLSLPLYQAEK